MTIKQFADDIKNHIKLDYNKKAYAYIFILAIILLSVNYTFDFEHTVIHNHYGTIKGVFIYTFYYSIPYYLAVVPFLLIKQQKYKFKTSIFWIKSFLILSVIGTFSSWSVHVAIAKYFGSNYAEVYFLKLLLMNLKKITPYLFSLYLIYLIFDRKTNNFYGLNKINISLKPFYLMLLFVLPLVLAASFLPDFKNYYPRFKYWSIFYAFDLNKLEMNVLFLICYAMDFVSVELIFRGALVIGMVSILGRQAVLPMALVYMVFHFGKPIGETISSFFGGYILGVLSYQHKNIKGGIIVHIGLAWMMELAAIGQYVFNK